MTGFRKESIKNAQLRQLIKIDDLKMAQYYFKAASCADDYFAALKLVQDVYTAEGYINADEASSSYRILKNHFFEKTKVFIGKKNEKVIFTLSLFPDSSDGLPMDQIYKRELDHLRSRGRTIGEVGCLATHPECRDGSHNLLMYGKKIMLKYAMEYFKLDDLVVTVHPKHAELYKEAMMFDNLGESGIKSYPQVNSNPAVALRLNLHEVEEKYRHFYQNNSVETNLHHFLFVKQSSTIEFPEENTSMYNNSNSIFHPIYLAGQKGIPFSSNPMMRQSSCF